MLQDLAPTATASPRALGESQLAPGGARGRGASRLGPSRWFPSGFLQLGEKTAADANGRPPGWAQAALEVPRPPEVGAGGVLGG